VHAQAVCAGGFTAGGAWAIAFPPPHRLKFFVIARGHCWLAVEGLGAPFRMGAGDVLMLSAPHAFVASSDPALCGASREGAGFACRVLAQLIFLQILRAHLAREGELAPGLLRVLADRRLAPALRLMHAQPARSWHLPELASAAAMSRTAFATRFKALAGMGPLAYLAQWRMPLGPVLPAARTRG
jgi:hypothetical protein